MKNSVVIATEIDYPTTSNNKDMGSPGNGGPRSVFKAKPRFIKSRSGAVNSMPVAMKAEMGNKAKVTFGIDESEIKNENEIQLAKVVYLENLHYSPGCHQHRRNHKESTVCVIS